MTEDSRKAFDRERIRAQLRRWQERLLDLSRANPLLALNRSRVSKLCIIAPSLPQVFEMITSDDAALTMPLVRRRTGARAGPIEPDEEVAEVRYELVPGDVTFEGEPADIFRRTRRLYDNARVTVEERGVTTLHLTFGELAWEDPAMGSVTSPLWLVPCVFESQGTNAGMVLKMADDEAQVNPALALYLRERHKIELPSMPEDGSAADLQNFIEAATRLAKTREWSVSLRAWLSTFNFESLVLYNDLRALSESAEQSPLIAALARATELPEASEALGRELDEMPSPAQVPIPVLPADSSQLKALTLCATGRHVVIHGPPGTGKSQTISSLIADTIGRGKTVLFVSAKMAALSVVHDRLAALGLDRYCLEAHSTKAGKSRVIEEIRRTLHDLPSNRQEALDESLADLVAVRNQLNGYVRELHRRLEPLGKSVFQAIGKLAKLDGAPEIRSQLPWVDLLSVDRGQLRSVLDRLDDLAAQANVFDERAHHPWRGVRASADTLAQQEGICSDLGAMVQSINGIENAASKLDGLIGTKLGDCNLSQILQFRAALGLLLSCEMLPPAWGHAPVEHLSSASSSLDEAAKVTRELATVASDCSEFTDLPPSKILPILDPVAHEFRPWHRAFNSRYWRWRSALRRRLAPGCSISFSSLLKCHAVAARAVELETWLRARDQALRALIPGAETLTEEMLRRHATRYQAAAMLRETASACGLTLKPDEIAVGESERAAIAGVVGLASSKQLDSVVAHLSELWPKGLVADAEIDKSPLTPLRARCEEALGQPERLREWITLSHTLAECSKANLGSFINGLGELSAKQAPVALEKRFYSLWAQAATSKAQLGTLTGERLEQRVSRFRELDGQLRRLALAHVKATGSEAASRISSSKGSSVGSGELATLQRELAKQKRFKPLRKLFAETPHVLQALKPCMLMSPLSVSTFLKPGVLDFDLVVFDEASQLPVQEAVPAILRAQQVVVAGDSKQLPPTSFFDASTIADLDGDDAEDETLEPLESLLDDCVAVRPVFEETALKWHYRSRDERLIKFSNHYFYDNSLVTFPSSSTSGEGRGVHLSFVPDGVWDRGRSRTNRREALRVAQLVVEQLDRYPERSIGVAAMNVSQREAIETALEDLLAGRSDLRPLMDAERAEPFFIKALENVQGDERDTIILSVGYAKTETGSFSLSFGPLNRDGGWRRLNVLVTRAKWQLILVTSLRNQDLAAVSPSNRGATALRDYIAYAERGGRLPPQPAQIVDAETNEFEEAVAEALRSRGLEIDEQVGSSGYRIDLAIRDPRDPHRYLLGVECDGASYHSAPTARDRDLLRQEVLRQQGWRLHRIWSTDWFYNPARAIQGVMLSVDRAMASEPTESVIATPAQDAALHRAERHPIASVAPITRVRYPGGKPYVRYKSIGTRDYLMEDRYCHVLGEQIAHVIAIEAPMHLELLYDRLKEVNGVARAGSNIDANIRKALAQAARRGLLRWTSRESFIRTNDGTLATFRIPSDGVDRSIVQIAPEEIGLAVLHVVEAQFGHPRDSLPRVIGSLFGIARTSVDASEFIDDAVAALLADGKLRADGMSVYIA